MHVRCVMILFINIKDRFLVNLLRASYRLLGLNTVLRNTFRTKMYAKVQFEKWQIRLLIQFGGTILIHILSVTKWSYVLSNTKFVTLQKIWIRFWKENQTKNGNNQLRISSWKSCIFLTFTLIFSIHQEHKLNVLSQFVVDPMWLQKWLQRKHFKKCWEKSI